VLAIGANFACHLARVQSTLRGEPVSEDDARGLFPAPWGFVIVNDSIIGQDATVTPPSGTVHLDYEAEVGAVLATGGRDLAPEDVRFWGMVPFNDFSLRDPHLGKGDPFDRGPLTWTLQKNFETGKAMGPWVQVLDEPGAAPNVEISCRVNGELRQEEWSEQMIWKFPDVVAHLSHFIRLNPGDVIVSGTPKGTALEEGADGAFWLRSGDSVETSIGGVGVLRNTIGTWAEA
jgi:2-keto-4-pentenoate hydratase/2-oxohepta-3-ene-1,7-dioic acid hydratase in catechol pathway